MSKGSILVVEDNPVLMRIYRDLLSKDDYEVMEAPNGELAVEIVEAKKPTLVLLDIGLPKMTGFEVLQKIRGQAASKDIPVVILSVQGEQKDVNRGLELGANDYAVKGFYSPKQILLKINALLKSEGKASNNLSAYKLSIKEARHDAAKLQDEIGFTHGYQCPECHVDMVLELYPDFTKTDGHWFSSHFLCPKCFKTF